MSKVIVGMGLPGSGKTTLLKRLAIQRGWPIISVDAIRSVLGTGETDQTVNRAAWDEAYMQLGQLQKHHPVVIFDATFAQQWVRLQFLQKAREAGYEHVHGILFKAPDGELERRMQERGRIVPVDAMERMQKSLNDFPPKLEEVDEKSGMSVRFDVLSIIDTRGELDAVIQELERSVSGTINRELTKLR